jgi:hypothetical protein
MNAISEDVETNDKLKTQSSRMVFITSSMAKEYLLVKHCLSSIPLPESNWPLFPT